MAQTGKKKTEEIRKFKALMKNGETKEIIAANWYDHIMSDDEIESFTTLVDKQLYHVRPNKGEAMFPFTEYNGDHSMNWIVCYRLDTNEEVFRKNTRTVDMINWKLSSPLTKSK